MTGCGLSAAVLMAGFANADPLPIQAHNLLDKVNTCYKLNSVQTASKPSYSLHGGLSCRPQ